LSLLGCGDNRGNVVTGKVLLKGEPVAGEIIYKGPSGKESRGGILNGEYTVTQCEAGMNKITIRSFEAAMPAPPAGAKTEITGITGVPKDVKGGAAAPAKYSKEGAIPDFEVKRGTANKNDITLEP
jgi:hypothetical protein